MYRGEEKLSSSPQIAGVQWSSTVESILRGMASGVAVLLGIVLGLAEITPASWQLQRAAWRRSEGPAGQGLVLVKAGVASESRAHAVRGFRNRENTSRQHSGGSSASTFAQCVAGSHSGATVPEMAEQ